MHLKFFQVKWSCPADWDLHKVHILEEKPHVLVLSGFETRNITGFRNMGYFLVYCQWHFWRFIRDPLAYLGNRVERGGFKDELRNLERSVEDLRRPKEVKYHLVLSSKQDALTAYGMIANALKVAGPTPRPKKEALNRKKSVVKSARWVLKWIVALSILVGYIGAGSGRYKNPSNPHRISSHFSSLSFVWLFFAL